MLELKEQVCTLDQSKFLKEKGVKQDSLFLWFNSPVVGKGMVIGVRNNATMLFENYAAFTVSELGELLQGGSNMVTRQADGKWKSEYVNYTSHHATEAEARAAMLINAIDRKLLKV